MTAGRPTRSTSGGDLSLHHYLRNFQIFQRYFKFNLFPFVVFHKDFVFALSSIRVLSCVTSSIWLRSIAQRNIIINKQISDLHIVVLVVVSGRRKAKKFFSFNVGCETD